MKKNILYILSLLTVILPFQTHGQTRVTRVNAIKANSYGVEYVLPETRLMVEVEYTETSRKAGQYARYASRYLGLKDSEVVFDDITEYTFDKVFVSEKGIPNRNQSYLVEFKAKTTAPFVYLNNDGVICTINAEYDEEPELERHIETNKATQTFINPQSIYTEEYLTAGSVSKMAEVAAKNIYSIRETRQDILAGEVENMPKDGEAMRIVLSALDDQERLWTELFLGTTEVKKLHKQIEIEPLMELEKEILFRFSKFLGLVDKGDLSGTPVYMNLKDLQVVEFEEPDPKRKAKEPQSVVYNVPGKALVELYLGNRKLYEGEHHITQFGKTQILTNKIFEDKNNPVRIYFNPKTGGIRQIIQ